VVYVGDDGDVAYLRGQTVNPYFWAYWLQGTLRLWRANVAGNSAASPLHDSVTKRGER
jgi:hypothetical protein